MFRFLLRPRWMISHILVLGSIIAMVNLSLWQSERLADKRTFNDKISSRADRPPEDLATVLRDLAAMSTAGGLDAEFRATAVSGEYQTAEEFTIPSRTFNGAPGRWLVTPLQWSDSDPEVLVLRGFIPQAIDDREPPIERVEPPAGPVALRGWVRMSQLPEGIQARSAELGEHQFARIDIERIEKATGRRYAPVYFQLGAQEPPTASPALSPVPLPERSEGPHFSYAVQWAIFTLIAIIGYPLIIRKVARAQVSDHESSRNTDGD